LCETDRGDRNRGEDFEERDRSQEPVASHKEGRSEEEPSDREQVEHGFETFAPVDRKDRRQERDSEQEQGSRRRARRPSTADEHASYGAERYDEKRHETQDAKGELNPWCLSAEHPRRET
jgi:hypothetical protein